MFAIMCHSCRARWQCDDHIVAGAPQDNTKDNPAAKVKLPQHFSKTVGSEPCQQLIVQLDRTPEVDNPGALSA